MMQQNALIADSKAPALIRLDPRDDVAIAVREIANGEMVAVGDMLLTALEPIPFGHKIALLPLARGVELRKFGWPIGRLTQDIAVGAHVHSHNLQTMLGGTQAYRYQPIEAEALPDPGMTFRGYRRADGRAATRNEIWVLPTVGCVARTAEKIARLSDLRHAGRVDGIHAYAHPHGCSQLGDDLAGTRSILAALACHPNAGRVLLVGLGCESNQIDALLAEIPEHLRGRIRTIAAQGVDDEVASGLAAVDALVDEAALAKRVDLPLGELVLGLKCGGSDGFSGLTANPLVGRMADAVAGAGGTTILSEIPEIFGAEQPLMARARDEAVFEAIASVVNGFKRYFLDHGQPVSENPSPGNIAGGITTLEEKSLGAVQKAGRAEVADVLRYGQRVKRKGLSLLEAPGNDAVSTTALAAAGATMILFTTGRGTPLGAPVPTVKIASNSALAERKRGWIDFDAGQVLSEGIEAARDALLAQIVALASGESTAAERNDEREMAIWKRGVTL